MIRLELTVQPGRLVLDKKLLRASLRAAGTEIANTARQLVRNSSGGGRSYTRKGRRYVASAPGQPPVPLSGALAGGFKVTVFKSGEGVAVRDRVFYARFMEAGAYGGGPGPKPKKQFRRVRRAMSASARLMAATGRGQRRQMQPRPFISVAAESRKDSIIKRLETSINQGLKFERMPVRGGRKAKP